MKSLRRSRGKIFLSTQRRFLSVLWAGLVVFLSSCTMVHGTGRSEADDGAPNSASTPISQDMESTLKEDQKTIEELRKNIPEPKRQENDHLKEVLSLMGEVKDPPQRIREKFNRITQRMRQSERRETQKMRDQFNRQEKKNREDFYKKLKDERGEFDARKASREERQRFFSDQDARRREFAADERDRRQQFNADMKMRADDFNTLMRDRTRDFNDEYRIYTQRYNDHMRQLKEKRANPRPEWMPPAQMKTGDRGP